ncbi:MAG: restriction endonuclease subunit S [Candidatus Bathyarchaeia archaeon]|jgi:type I restriction enzyme S subunit
MVTQIQIPTDWVLRRVGEIAPLQRGFDLPAKQIAKGEYPVVYSNGVLNFHNKYQAKGPGVITGRSGTIGRVTYIEDNYWPHNTTLWVTDFKDNDPKFIYYLYSFLGLEKYSTGSGVPTLNRNDVHAIEALIPKNRTEQSAMAQVLSDTDALVESLNRLVEKKKNIKLGAMQEFLTGKKRLPGFTGAWLVSTLMEITYSLDNLRVPLNESQRLTMKGDYPYCGANGILDYINKFAIDDDIILMAEDGGYFDEYSYRPIAYRMKGKCWVNNHAHILKAKANFSQDFIFYALVHKNILQYLTNGTRSKLNKSEMNKIEIQLPLPKEEQIAIAQVLYDMDLEIEALEQKRDKYKQLKVGMMQQLLTGRIRLKCKN